MGKHLLAKAQIANINELTELEVTELTSLTFNEQAVAILKRQGSRGITIASSQRIFIFDIKLNLYWLEWKTTRYKLAAKGFETSKCHQDTLNRYLFSGFIPAQIPWNAISNLELWRLLIALWRDLVLLSATTLSNICQWVSALTMDAIRKQLPSLNKVRLSLDGWTSMNKLTIKSVIAFHMYRNWALSKVQLAHNKVDHLFLSGFERWLRTIHQRPKYWSKASSTFLARAWSYWAYWWPCPRNYDW